MDISFPSLATPSFESVSKTHIAIATGAAAVFLVVAIWVYYTYVKPKLNAEFVPNKEFTKGQELPKVATLFFFGTEWCPHCKTAQKPWQGLKNRVAAAGGAVNGVKIHFTDVDCDKDAKLASKYNIKGYPTIKYARGTQVVEYDAKPDVSSLYQFLGQVTGDA